MGHIQDKVTYGTFFQKVHYSQKINYSHTDIFSLKASSYEALIMLFIHRKKNISLYLKITYMSGHVQDIFHLPKLISLSCVNTIYKFSNTFINIEVLYIKLIKNVYTVFSFEVGIVVITNYIWGHIWDKKSKPFSRASIDQKLGIPKNHII